MSEAPTGSTEAPPNIKLAAQTLHDSLLLRTGAETALMATATEDVRTNLLIRIPDELKPRIEKAIDAATIILEGVKRRDGTPHINHSLRVAIRTIDRLIKEQGSINLRNIEDVELAIQHDTQEDGRSVKRMFKYVIRRKIRRIAPDTTKKVLKNMNTFDQYNIFKRKKSDFEQKIRKAGLGAIKMDDTLDSMGGDMAKASTSVLALSERRGQLLTEEERKTALTALSNLTKSKEKTKRRFEFFREQLTHSHIEHIDTYLEASNLFIADLNALLFPDDQPTREDNPST